MENKMFEYLCVTNDGSVVQVVTSGNPADLVDAIDIVTIGEYEFANDPWIVR